MSWLSSLFGGGGEDPEAVRQRQAEAARLQAVAAQQASDRQMQMQLDYLNQLRADQAAKEAELKAQDPTATRNAALSTVGGVFAPEFESSAIPTSITDPLESEIYGQQRASADDYINRLFKRGVLTGGGTEAARAKLEEQAPRVRTQLQSIADTILGGERSKLTDIAGRAKERASSLNVGEGFDITPFQSAYNTELGNFNASLPDLFKSNISGDLFDTSGLGAVGGGAQFAGNTKYAPDEVVPGASTDETDPFSGQKPVQKRTSTVF
jgi:hypothetical protein